MKTLWTAYSWIVSTILQVLANLIFISVFFRLRQIDLPVLVNSERFPKFKMGPHFIVSLTSICSIFSKFKVLILLLKEFQPVSCLPFSWLNLKFRDLTLQSVSSWGKSPDSRKCKSKKKMMNAKSPKENKKTWRRKWKKLRDKNRHYIRTGGFKEKSSPVYQLYWKLLKQRKSALSKKNSMYGSSKGKSRKSNMSRIRTTKNKSVLGKKASVRKSRIMHLKRLEQQVKTA